MNRTRLLGWTLLLIVAYCMVTAVIYFAALLALQRGTLLDLPWLVAAQKSLIRGGMVTTSNWLSLPGCITPDPDLIYRPTDGRCRFDDIEFKTTLNFSAEGRYTGPKPSGRGIAVLGDSHAMGWGVNDLETFAAQLQQLTGRPVYNLGVASYGTTWEIIRLERSGVLDEVDTVIIQYCNNDHGENLSFDSANRQELAKKVFGKDPKSSAPQPSRLTYIAKGYGLTLTAPFRAVSERLRRKNFEPHYEPFISILEKHQSTLSSKRVIVFYSNPYGQRYRNFPAGPDARLPQVRFTDLGLAPSLYRKLDNHLTPTGHRVVAERLLKELR